MVVKCLYRLMVLSQQQIIYVLINILYLLATCPIPLSPDGGEVSVQTDGAVTTANYICADKYTLSSSYLSNTTKSRWW